MRTIVEIPEEQIVELAEICRREGISRAEAIRRAVRIYTRRHRGQDRRKVFGIWAKRKMDALAYEDQIRAEWGQKRD